MLTTATEDLVVVQVGMRTWMTQVVRGHGQIEVRAQENEGEARKT